MHSEVQAHTSGGDGKTGGLIQRGETTPDRGKSDGSSLTTRTGKKILTMCITISVGILFPLLLLLFWIFVLMVFVFVFMLMLLLLDNLASRV